VGAKVDLEVLLVGEGAEVKLGEPLVSGARVQAEVVSHGKHPQALALRTQEEGWDRIRGHPPAVHGAAHHGHLRLVA